MKQNQSLIHHATPEAKKLYNSKINDLATLRQRLRGAVLVAFDTEGGHEAEVSELGVAVLRPSELNLRRAFYAFYEHNDIEAFTIRTL